MGEDKHREEEISLDTQGDIEVGYTGLKQSMITFLLQKGTFHCCSSTCLFYGMTSNWFYLFTGKLMNALWVYKLH